MRTPCPKSKGCSQEASSTRQTRPCDFTIKLGMTSLKWLIKQLGPNSRRKHTIYSISRQLSLALDSQSLAREEAQPGVTKSSASSRARSSEAAVGASHHPHRERGSSGDKRGMQGRDEAGKPRSWPSLPTLQDRGR